MVRKSYVKVMPVIFEEVVIKGCEGCIRALQMSVLFSPFTHRFTATILFFVSIYGVS